MLTAEHIDARRRDGELILTRLDARSRAEAVGMAADYLEVARGHVGRTREELYEAWEPIETSARKRKLALGLRKLVDDACVFNVDETLDPIALRRTLFQRAAAARRERTSPDSFQRDALIEEVASAMTKTREELEIALFSDLRTEHILHSSPVMNAEALVEAFELGCAQAVLLRAVRVECTIDKASPSMLRAFFSWLKFHRLLFHASRAGGDTIKLAIDGPFSMFESVTKYGLRLALVLPALRTLESWTLTADIRWGKTRDALTFRMSSKDKTERSLEGAPPHVSDDVQTLLDGINTSKSSSWRAEIANVILDAPGVGVCVPDLSLQRPDRPRVYVEVLGYWSRDAVWKRIELAEKGVAAPIVFCVSSRLRVSAEMLDEQPHASLYVYKGKPSARGLLEHVENVAASDPRQTIRNSTSSDTDGVD
jgi:predicted nuclease of restriction endonuclease-like RecB superfamily